MALLHYSNTQFKLQATLFHFAIYAVYCLCTVIADSLLMFLIINNCPNISIAKYNAAF